MTKKILFFGVFFLLLLLLSFFNKDIEGPFLSFLFLEEKGDRVALRGTTVPKEIGHKEIWLKEKNPYLIDNDLDVKKDGFLIISPGTVVYIAPGRKISISGKISVYGTSDEPVYFFVNHKDAEKNKWGGIYIKNNNENIIEGVFLKSASLAINVFPEGKIEIRQSVLEKNNQAIFSNGGFLKVKQSVFRENKNGITAKKSEGVISENIFDENNLAIFLRAENVLTINNNFFKNNNNFAFKYAATPVFYLGGNYFDTHEPRLIERKIYDGSDKKTFEDNGVTKRGTVVFEPFLKEKPLLFTPLNFNY